MLTTLISPKKNIKWISTLNLKKTEYLSVQLVVLKQEASMTFMSVPGGILTSSSTSAIFTVSFQGYFVKYVIKSRLWRLPGQGKEVGLP